MPKGRSILGAVYALMADEGWRTLLQIRDGLSMYGVKYVSETTVSARIRDLRKLQYGAFTVERRKRHESRQYEYRLVVDSSKKFLLEISPNIVVNSPQAAE
jgi:CYTH domain-containing protein